MSINTITYADKQATNVNANINANNKCQASDMNEIKTVVNANANLQGDLSSLNTTTKTSIVGAINEVLNREILTATIAGDKTFSSTSDTLITLVQNSKIGSKLSVSSGKVVIGSGVSYVLISGKANFNSLTSSSNQRYFKIKQNGTEIMVSRISSPSNTNGLAFTMPPQLVPVSAGDEISASVQGVSGDVLRETAIWTYITIEVVK